MTPRLGVMTTYHYEHPSQLHLLRLFVDSVRAHVRRDEYATLLIVDDCSREDSANTAYLEWLQQSGTAMVYRLGPPRTPFYHPQGKGGALPSDTSYGHAMGIMAGFHKLRELGCTHAWVVDADCVVLDEGFLADALALFSHERVVAVTDYFGGRPETGVTQLCDERYVYRLAAGQVLSRSEKALQPLRAALFLYGFPNMFCALVDLQVEERFGQLLNAGWVNSRWGYRLFLAGYRTAYFPFFQGCHVFHHGLGMTRFNTQKGQTLGNSFETARYGGRDSGIYHAGFLRLVRTTIDYFQWLGQAYEGRPCESPPVLLDPSWLVAPIDVPMHGREAQFLRPFSLDDFPALRQIDASRDTTQFLSWGPHGEAETRAFLQRAQGDCRRWLVFADGTTNTLIGYGELRPEGPRPDGARGVGLSYVLRPDFQRQRLGTVLLKALVETASSQQSYSLCLLRIDTEHRASRRVMEQTGQPWEKVGTERYVLKGAERQRDVYVYHVGCRPGLPPADPLECRRDREETLFGYLGMWR